MQHSTRTPIRAVQRIAALGVATLAAIGLTLGAASPALAHDELINTSLEFNNTTGEVSALNLTFSNSIMAVGTEIIVTDEAGTNVSSAEPELSGPTVRQAFDAPLAAGAYQAVWRVVSSDGHPIQGASYFEVAEDGSAELSAIGEDDPRFAEDEHADDGHADSGTASAQAGTETTNTGDAQSEGSSFPVIGWVAIAAVLVLGVGGAVSLSARKRKQAAASAPQDSTETVHESDSTN